MIFARTWIRSWTTSSSLPSHLLSTLTLPTKPIKTNSHRIPTIAQILSHNQASLSTPQPIRANGWVRTVRAQKNVSFIELMDGTCRDSLQVVVNGPLSVNVRPGTAVQVTGDLVRSPSKATQTIEVRASQVDVVGPCDPTYPIQLNPHHMHTIDHLRTHMHLRPRTWYIWTIQRIRHTIFQTMHTYFHENQYVHVHTPVLTYMDCEGGGQTFNVSAKSHPIPHHQLKLTMSSQLHLEMVAGSIHPRVYTLSPCFRAEKSCSTKHLSEFYMLEVEQAFVNDLAPVMHTVMDVLQAIGHAVRTHHEAELVQLNEQCPGLIQRLDALIHRTYVQVTYKDAIAFLVKHPKNMTMDRPVTQFGDDLLAHHEQILLDEIGKPVFVTDYPKSLKPFYMMAGGNGDVVQCFDLLVPHVGELAGGSVRLNCVTELTHAVREFGLDPNLYAWYLDLRKFGSPPHAGFGLGFDRLVKYLVGAESVREVVPIPRYFGAECKY